MSEAAGQPAAAPVAAKAGVNWIVLLPLLAFLALAGLFLVRLFAGDASTLPSTLIGKPAPDMPLPALPGLVADGKPVPGLDRAALTGAPTVVNVFASWCVPCHVEHPLLMKLAASGVRIVGINHKDPPENALSFLKSKGNPFRAVGVDRNGRASIEWGVYGVPETFVLDAEGRIALKHVGPLTEAVIAEKIAPLLAKLAQK
jgi:cytochrome c biogenesis protein CcmG/thiol:disulfide interchange protein DsbE